MGRPSEIETEIARLQAERDGAFRDLSAMRKSIDQLAKMAAKQGEQLDQVVNMLRRRESQLKRAEAEVRKLRRQLGLDPDPTPSGDASDAPTSQKPTKKARSARKKKSKGARGESGSQPSGGGRRLPPAHLPAETETHTVDGCGACGGRTLKRDVLETVLYTVIQAHVRRRVIRRERVLCADPDCHQPTTAPMPPMPCQRALYDCRFLAWLVMMKFSLLVPLDRVRTHLQSQGIDIAMGTLVHLISRAASLGDAVDGEHWRQLRAGDHICFDGTGLKTLVSGQSKAWDAYLEVFTRDELTVFQFDVTKHADGLRHRLAGFTGMVVCDAESRNAAGTPGLLASNCNAHPLRKLRDAERAQPHLAAQGQRFIRALYDLEELAELQGLDGAELVAFRQRRSRRVLRRFRQWLYGVLKRNLPPTDPVQRVARYYLKHFDDLSRYIDHAHLPLDNNASEREFQRHAKLRFASLFAGSTEGGHRWATLLGVVRTAQKCEVDIEAYLTWMFERHGSHRKKFAIPVAQLTPMAYRAHLAASLTECA
jgi:transposase